MADLITASQARPTDWAGDFVPAARVTFFLSGTTTPATVYQDSAGTIPFVQPVLADAEGVLPPIYASASLKAVITDPDGAELPGSPIDPCIRSISNDTGAALVTFSPTPEIPETNVQDAIERVQANLGDSLADAGVAVTQAPLLADIDATNTPSGRYRYSSATLGTFPSAVTKADGGVIVISSGIVGHQAMELCPRDGGLRFQRVLVSLAWQAWTELAVFPQGGAQGAVLARGAAGFGSLALGGNGQVLRANSPNAEWGGPFLAGTVSTATGTGHVFLIPTTASVIRITSIGTSLSGTDNMLLRLGTGGADVTTGYTSYSLRGSSLNVTATNGLVISIGASSAFFTGKIELIRHTGNTWFCSHAGATDSTGADNVSGAGWVALGGAIDRVVFTRSGTNTFSAASINVHYS